jgi:hypothetical protein
LQGERADFPAVFLGEILFTIDLPHEGHNRLQILSKRNRTERFCGGGAFISEANPPDLDGAGGFFAMEMAGWHPDGLSGDNADGAPAFLIPKAFPAEDQADFVKGMAVQSLAVKAGRFTLNHAKPESGKILYIIHFITQYLE